MAISDQLRPGDIFNPWRRFKGILVPDSVLSSTLSPGAKLCYGVLARFSGENGECFPSMATIAARMGVSDRQAKSYISELERGGFILRRRGGVGRSNRYAFTWHERFDADSIRLTSGMPMVPDQIDGNDSSHHTGSILPFEIGSILPTKRIIEENQGREHTDLDYQDTHRKEHDAHPGGARRDESHTCSAGSSLAMEELSTIIERMLGRKPTNAALVRILSSARGDAEIALDAIRDAEERGYGEGKNAPHSMSWFESVVLNYYLERTRRDMPPVAAPEQMDVAEFHRAIAAFDPLEDAA